VCSTAEFIATGGEDGLIRVITHKSRSILNELIVHRGRVLQIIPAVGFPQRIHSVSTDRTLTTTDVAAGKRICQQLTAGRIAFTAIAQFTDGETEILVSMGDGSIRGYDWPREGIVLESSIPQQLQINAIALRPNTRLLVCGGESEYLSIGNFKTGEWKLGGAGHSTPVRSLAWTTDGRYLISCADDGVALWNL
jgi:WD40 repeat protein